MKLLALIVLTTIGCAATGSVTEGEQRQRDALAAKQAEENDAKRQATITEMHRQEARDTLARLCTTPDTPERQQWCLQMQQEQVRLDQEQQRIELGKRADQAAETEVQNPKAEVEKPRRGVVCPSNDMGTTILKDCK